MPKSLGQIHNVSTQINNIQFGSINSKVPIDIAGELSFQLSRNIRQGNYFKLCGIDISVEPSTNAAPNGGSISGYFRFYAPTKGRCAAFRHAFKSMADQMKMSGISMRDNAGYDFRVALTEEPVAAGLAYKNQASLDGVRGLSLNDFTSQAHSIFDVYNTTVLPTLLNVPPADLFSEGFDTLLQSGGAKTDFVLNDTDLYSGNPDYASKSYEDIPFQVSWTPGARTPTFQWRPDPALYQAVMTGNLEMVIEDVAIDGATNLNLEVSMMIAGWKSIMSTKGK